MEWMEQAVCKQVDPDLFVGDGHANDLRRRHARAIKICQTCPVIFQCRDYALRLAAESPVYGVWGGLTQAELNRQARRYQPGQVA